MSDAGVAVVVSPHLDDAVLSRWSVLTQEREVLVLNVFTGDPDPAVPRPWDELTGATDPVVRQAERREEDRAALRLAGRTGVGLGVRPPATVHAAAHVGELLAAAVPAGSELHLPAGIGGHAAHVLVRDTGLALRRRAAGTLLYADVPYATRYGWPGWVTGDPPDPFLRPDAAWKRDVASAPLDGAGMTPVVARLDAGQAERKLAAVRCYRTQLAALEEGPVGRVSHPRLRGFELAWRLS